MTEDDARDWIGTRYPHTLPALERLLHLLRDEAGKQNLVASSTLATPWNRHIVDSAQLVPLSAEPDGTWLDIGTGAGFPGLVIAIVTGAPVLCVEPRARRVAWLAHLVDELALSTVTIAHSTLAHVTPAPVATITARAVAALPKLLDIALPFATPTTRWLLPKGASARDEVDDAARQWQGVFHVEQSLTDPAAGIVVATDVRRWAPHRT